MHVDNYTSPQRHYRCRLSYSSGMGRKPNSHQLLFDQCYITIKIQFLYLTLLPYLAGVVKLIWGVICQIWTSFDEYNLCFCNDTAFQNGEINEQSISKPYNRLMTFGPHNGNHVLIMRKCTSKSASYKMKVARVITWSSYSSQVYPSIPILKISSISRYWSNLSSSSLCALSVILQSDKRGPESRLTR